MKREEQLRKEADAQVKLLEREQVQAREFRKVYEQHVATLLRAKHEVLDENNTIRVSVFTVLTKSETTHNICSELGSA